MSPINALKKQASNQTTGGNSITLVAAVGDARHVQPSDDSVSVTNRKSLVTGRHGGGLQRGQRAEEAATWPDHSHHHHTIC